MQQCNFTPRFQQVLALAQIDTFREPSELVNPVHFFFAIVRLGEGVAYSVLRKNYRIEESDFSGQVRNLPLTGREIRFSPDSIDLMATASNESIALGHSYVGTEHILLALAHDRFPEPQNMLRSLGVSYGDELKSQILRELELS